MKHHIIAKFVPDLENRAALVAEIERLFAASTQTPGIHSCRVLRNCVRRPNRYDLMIVIDMDADALPLWDASNVHREWKTRFGPLLEAKAIFDCE